MITRTCANCAAFYPDPDIKNTAPECWNLVSFTEHAGSTQALRRAPGPTDCCNHHQTHQEDAKQTAYIDQHRDAIMAGIRRQAAAQEHQDAERVMRKAVAKMRKGSAS